MTTCNHMTRSRFSLQMWPTSSGQLTTGLQPAEQSSRLASALAVLAMAQVQFFPFLHLEITLGKRRGNLFLCAHLKDQSCEAQGPALSCIHAETICSDLGRAIWDWVLCSNLGLGLHWASAQRLWQRSNHLHSQIKNLRKGEILWQHHYTWKVWQRR